MFLILGILIVLFMITLKVAIEPSKRITRPGEFNTGNIRNEFSNVQKYTVDNQTTLITNLNNFSGFMIDRLQERKITLSMIYVNGFISKTNASIINITVGNYLGSSITNVNVSFGNATGTQNSYLLGTISNRNYNYTNLTFSILDQEKHINVTYTLNGNRNTIFYTFTPKNDSTTESSLFDLTYTILDKATKDRFVQTDYL